jgi:hypothetical protein
MRVIGHLVFSFAWCFAAGVALKKLDSGDAFYKAKLVTARFYFAKLYPESASLIKQARAGSAPLMELEEALF